MNINRRKFIQVGLGALGGLQALAFLDCVMGAEPPSREGHRPPNLIFILADDLGLDGVGCYGSDERKTPNLDALARSGMRFETCYATPLCGPTRCQLLTGRYPFRTGGLDNQVVHKVSPRHEFSVARLLKQAGYVTGQVGKWRQVGGSPSDWGFDEYLTDSTAGGLYWENTYIKNGKDVRLNKNTYYPDVMHEFAVDFIARHKGNPFFLYYAMHLVHEPIQRTPDSQSDRGDLYADNIAYMDKLVGKLVEALRHLHLRENTLVIFAGDNGTTRSNACTVHGKLISGCKGSMKEGGARVPLIASWPASTPSGRVSTDLVDFSDFFPTFADIGGATIPEGLKHDGHSIAALLRGQRGEPREWVFVQLSQCWYVRNSLWKLTNDGELFDMSAAPFEEKLVPNDTNDPSAIAARKSLQSVLDALDPATGNMVSTSKIGKKSPKQRELRREMRDFGIP